ncbi:MAG: haloacid dehalogenase type II [Rhodobacteraceae bacterium]|nr:haloacid dehalogenase type II [Paracoccaceae bacterium]
MSISTCIFDAYGTLFDVGAAAREAAKENTALADAWPGLAADWRRKQLEYSWLRAVAGTYCDFWQLTQDGLDWAMEAAGLSDAALRQRLLDLYWELQAYPEVPEMLEALAGAGKATGILSNGSPKMLDAAVTSAGIGDLLDATLSVESVGIFKPAASVYDLVGQHFRCTPSEVLFVSSNGWDAAHAAAYGFETVWVNREGLPMDRLPGAPAHVVSDLTAISGLAL